MESDYKSKSDDEGYVPIVMADGNWGLKLFILVMAWITCPFWLAFFLWIFAF